MNLVTTSKPLVFEDFQTEDEKKKKQSSVAKRFCYR